mmetsp:Transcript_9112/g.23063  ORF Transcript_9112/g.23063 Transcript_9112/m.23063 type:complete len:813 (-) Transcript_9112:202-2640(-)
MPFDPFGSSNNSILGSSSFSSSPKLKSTGVSSSSSSSDKIKMRMYQKHYELEDEVVEDDEPVLQYQGHRQHAQYNPNHTASQSITATPQHRQQPQQQQRTSTAAAAASPLPVLSSSRPPMPLPPKTSSSLPPILSKPNGGSQNKTNVVSVGSTAAGISADSSAPSSSSAYPLIAPPPRAPSRLPPKSPASLNNSNNSHHAAARRILSVGSDSSSGRRKGGRRSRSKSRDRNKNSRSRSRSNSTTRSRGSSGGGRRRNSITSNSSNNTSFDSSSASETDDTDQEDENRSFSSSSFVRRGRNRKARGGNEPSTPSIQDPTPDRLRVETDTDDLSNAPDFSLLTFEPQSVNPGAGGNAAAAISNGNLVSGQPLPMDHPLSSLPAPAVGNNTDSTTPQAVTGISSGRSCLAVPKILRRGKNQRVQVADVASVGGYSDTLVSINSNLASGVWQNKPGGRITGRELHETAKAFLNDGDYEQALHLFETILKAQRDRFGGVEHSSVGAALHNVGVVRLRMGEYEVAEDVLLQALEVRQSVLGKDHLDLAATLAKLGSARSALQKFDEGLGDLRGALQITRRVLGRSHRTVAQIQCHIACLYFEAGELFSAQATFEDALEIYREIFQKEELADRDAVMAQLTETLCNIGSIQNKRKNFEGAIESFHEAVNLQQGIMGHDHPRVIQSLDNLGYSFSKSKSYNQALACYRQMLTAQISHHGAFSIECCDTIKKQTVIFSKIQNKEGAIKAVSSYLDSVKEKSGEDDPVVEELQQMLVDLQSTKKRTGRSKAKKAEKGERRRDRSLDCFDRILFDRNSRLCEF